LISNRDRGQIDTAVLKEFSESTEDGHPAKNETMPSTMPISNQPSQGAHPNYAYSPKPEYPILLREQGIGGVVRLRVFVDSHGRPAKIKLAKGSGYRLLDESALQAVKKWCFFPAKDGEKKLASWVEFPILFTLHG
jgi:protein TonB